MLPLHYLLHIKDTKLSNEPKSFAWTIFAIFSFEKSWSRTNIDISFVSILLYVNNKKEETIKKLLSKYVALPAELSWNLQELDSNQRHTGYKPVFDIVSVLLFIYF